MVVNYKSESRLDKVIIVIIIIIIIIIKLL